MYKVIIIGPAYPLRGGLATFNERLAKAFTDANMQTLIYTFSLQYPSFLFPGKTQYSDAPPPANTNIKVCINSINPFNWLRIGYRLKKENADIIIVRYWLPFMGPCLGTLLRLAKKNKKSKIVCIADNIIPHEKRLGDHWFTKYFLASIDAAITMSETVMHDLKKFKPVLPALKVAHPLYDNFGEKVPMSIAKSKLNLEEDTTIFLFFGFIRKYKGLQLLLESINLLKQQHFFEKNKIQFLIAGEFYESPDAYLNYIEENKLQAHLIMHNDFVSDQKVKYYFGAAHCIIQPYMHATQSGVTPLAYHFEKPMIVTNVGALPDMVPPGVGIVCNANANSVTQAIATFVNNKKEEYTNNIQKEKKKYSWTQLLDAILSLTQQIHKK